MKRRRNQSPARLLLQRLHPGKTFEEIVRGAIAQHDTPEGAAASLGVSVTTLRGWLKDCEEQSSAAAAA